MLKVITGQNNTAAYVRPHNQCRDYSTMHYNVQAQIYMYTTVECDKTQVTSTHVEQPNITHQCTVYRKHQSHSKN